MFDSMPDDLALCSAQSSKSALRENPAAAQATMFSWNRAPALIYYTEHHDEVVMFDLLYSYIPWSIIVST